MDIDKEREAFEAHIKSTYPMGEQLAKDCGKTLCELYSSEWQSWQAAKAQAVAAKFEIGRLEDRIADLLDERQDLYAQLDAEAVPEGFVLMPIKPTETMVMAVVKEHEGEAFLPYSLYDAYVRQAMIEAQEPAND